MQLPQDPGGEAQVPAHYVLGHAERELQRLAQQAARINPITRQFLLEAGLAPGMRVLDVGTGAGDVAFLASDLVGVTGVVVGVDRSPTVLALARQRAAGGAVGNVSFEAGDPVELTFAAPFDAVVGRYVLEFQPDPAALLRRLRAQVRPGGIVAFHEGDWGSCQSAPPVPLWDRCCRLVAETLARRGADPRVGTKLPSIFAAAGLPPPAMRMTTLIGAGANSQDVVHHTLDLVLSLLPAMRDLGLVTPSEVDPDTLATQVLDALSATGSLVTGPAEIAAWSRV